MQKDRAWFCASLTSFNGVVLMPNVHPAVTDIYVDASLFAFGVVIRCQAYHLYLADTLTGWHITQLEMLNIYVALSYWGPRLSGSYFNVYCDN